ncbi:MAG: hypothetical protein LBQ79_13920, partial [Deltaproteobacteria bacterium]|nr:hypothetical protein [Deltaproteobacteria bacterium]
MTIAKLFRNHFTLAFRAGGAVPASLLGAAIIISVLTGCGSGPSGPSGDGGDAAGADSSKAARGPLPSGADSPGSPPGSAPAPPETEEPLEVLQFLPSGEIDVFTQAAVMFSRPMAVIGELDKADQSLIAVEPPIPGKVVWINEYVLGFVPDRPVTGSLEVTVRLSPEVRSLSGAAVAGGPTETEFTLPALAVERRRTAGRGAGGDPLRPQVEITFNQPVDALEFNGKSRFFWESSDGKGSAGAVWTSAGYGDGGIFGGERTFTATAEEGLPRDAAWSLTVGKGAPLASGLSELSEDFLAASGRTYGRPGILATGFGKPDDGLGGAGDGGERGPEQVMGRPEYGHLLVRFDTPIEMGEAAPFITIDPPHPEFTKLNRARSGGGCGKGAASPCAGSDPAPSGSPSPSDADPPSSPDADPSAFPDADPSVFPDADPSPVPESDPSAFPDADPSAFPEADPSAFPEADPSAFPEADPSAFPEAVPSAFPEAVPSAFPEADPPERQDAGVPSGDEAAASDSPSGVSPSPEAECAGGSDVRTKLSVWRYAPNTDYVLTFRKGMPDVYGQKLDSDRVVRFRTGPFDPQAMLGTRGGIMESSFPPVVPVRVRNMNAIPAFGKVMADAEAARFLEMWPYAIWNGPIGWKPDAAAEWLDAASRPGPGNYSMTLVPERDSTRYVSAAGLDLGALLEGREKDGLIFAGAGGRHSYALFQVTDLAVTAKIGAAGSLAWVTRMSDGSGVEGAGVTVLDCMGRSLWSGVTGAGGTAALPGAEALGRELSPECGKSPPAVHVSASKGGERVFWSLGWSRDLDPRNMGAAGYREPFADDSLEAFLVTSQPVYRPGETAGMKAVVRRVGADGLATPGPGRVKLTVTDPAGAAAYEGFAEMSDYGTVALEWPVPEDAPAGNFRVEIDLGPPGGWESEGSGDAQGPAVPASGSGRSGSGPGPAPAVSGPARSGAGPGEYARGPRRASGTFRVAWHRAPAFGLTLGAVADALFGDGVIFRAKGEYYHGAPLGGAFRFELRHSPDWGHRPPGYGPEWSFTAREALMTEGGGWDYDPSPPGTAADGEAAAGPDGTAVFAAAIPSGGAPVPLRCELVVTASDLDGREVSRSESFTARPASLAAGLKTDGWMAFEGKPFGVALAVAGPDGRAVPGRSVRIRLMRRVWSAAGRLMLGGRFARTSDAFDELVSERTVESSSVPVRFEVTPRDAGEHYVAAELRDPEGRRAVASTGFWVPGDRVPWRAPEDGRVALAADAGTYAPGDP